MYWHDASKRTQIFPMPPQSAGLILYYGGARRGSSVTCLSSTVWQQARINRHGSVTVSKMHQAPQTLR
jgi:hypothetical protein